MTHFMGNTTASAMARTRNLAPSTSTSAPNPNNESSGNRKAVLVSVMYYGQRRAEVRGTLNAGAAMYGLLRDHLNYKEEDIVILTENSQYPHCQPTKKNIVMAMQWLVKDAQPGDTLFFFYSGHGYYQEDFGGEESECFDSIICPLDHRNPRTGALETFLTDDDMHRYMFVHHFFLGTSGWKKILLLTTHKG